MASNTSEPTTARETRDRSLFSRILSDPFEWLYWPIFELPHSALAFFSIFIGICGLLSRSTFGIVFIAGGVIYVGTAGISEWTRIRSEEREELDHLRANSLPQRAKHAAQVLQEATTLVEELQAELTARTALLEDVQRQVAETTERAADMEKLTQVDKETTRVLNKYFDEALKHRLGELERSARGREWLIGTVVALLIGIAAILLSHYVLHF